MTTSRHSHTATLLPDGRVLIAGGYTTGCCFVKAESSAELYDPSTGTFTATGSMSTGRVYHSATLLPNGKVLIAGGAGGSIRPSAEIYDPGTGKFSGTGEMTISRWDHTATLLNDGRVLIAGGHQVAGPCTPESPCLGGYLAGAELYDPVTGRFAPSGAMNENSADTATLLPNGNVLITRSFVYDTNTNSASFVRHSEIYDSSNGEFAFTEDMTAGHEHPTASLLLDGKVLIAGGDYGDGAGASNIAELYDPSTGAFTVTANLTSGRKYHSATLLPDGMVLFAGGIDLFDSGGSRKLVPLASAETYDPVQAATRVTGSMPGAREFHTATLLKDGRVLIAGGIEIPEGVPVPILSTALLYTPRVLVPAAALLSLAGDGQGQGAIQHATTYQLASPGNPAVAGEVLAIYCTGLADGSAIPPQVAIGGLMAEVLWFGNSPGYIGLNQVNVRVPNGAVRGPAVSVRLNYLGRASNEVTIGVK